MESVAAENLHGFVDDEIEHFAAVDLRDRAFDRVLFQHFHRVRDFVRAACGFGRRHRRFDVSGAAIDHRLDGEKLNRHLGQLFFHQPEIADLLAKRFALFRVFRRRRQVRAFEPPIADAPSVNRPAFKTLNATMCPRPISCSTFSLGTLQFSRKIGVVELP